MAAERPVTLVVLTWNRWDLTRRCLESLRETDLGGAEVLVVDNGSTDGTPARLAQLDWVRTIALKENTGFVRGNNRGIEAAPADHDVVLLNNDLIFTQRDWLRRLRACAHSAPDIGVVGCRLRLPDGRLLHAGTYIMPDTLWGQQIGSLEKDLGQFPGVRDAQGIVFACAYLKREVISRIGPLSTAYESYFEDTDYCLRAREGAFRTVVCGQVTLVHDEHGSTEHTAPFRERVFEASRQTFGRKWGSALEARYRHHVLWQSIMNFPHGYATSCREILKALDDEGVRATYRYAYGPGTVFPPEEPEQSGDYRLNVLRSRPLGYRAPVGVVYGQGDVFANNRAEYKVGFTMLEVDGFPREWVRQANLMDEVWVPTEFNRTGLMDCGATRPVHVIPLGIDPDYFHPEVARWPNPQGEFVFLASFEWGERKEPWLLIKAFNQAFTAKEPVRLLCKIINRDPQVSLRREIRKLRLERGGGRISYLFNLQFPHYQLASLYRSADCFVAPSRGEGWDLPLMEAMACGLPAIATDWSGHTAFVRDNIAYPLRVQRLVPARARCPYYDGFRWAEPDRDHLVHLLRHVYEHREEARQKGRAAAAEIASRWTWRHTARRIVERLGALGS